MSQMLLLDKRTQGLIEDYVPQGDILEGVVCFFFRLCRLYAGKDPVRARHQRTVRHRHLPHSRSQPDHRLPSAPLSEKRRNRQMLPPGQSHLLQPDQRFDKRRFAQRNRVFGLLIANNSRRILANWRRLVYNNRGGSKSSGFFRPPGGL